MTRFVVRALLMRPTGRRDGRAQEEMLMKARLALGTMLALMFGLAACGASGDPGAEAVAAFEHDPLVVQEVKEHGTARREIPSAPAEEGGALG